MKVRNHVRRWLHVDNADTPAGRSLPIEQFRILTSQIPVLYGVLIVDSCGIAYVLPPSLRTRRRSDLRLDQRPGASK